MWNNIGGKLKKLAKVVCWVGIIISVIAGIAIMTNTGNSVGRVSYNGYYYGGSSSTLVLSGFWGGLVILVLGCLGSWIGSWSLYALGEVVEAAEGSPVTKVASVSGTEHVDGSWTCTKCKASNPASRATCMECGTAKFKTGTWTCSCGASNPNSRGSCMECGKMKS